jgi:hypothetical protein
MAVSLVGWDATSAMLNRAATRSVVSGADGQQCSRTPSLLPLRHFSPSPTLPTSPLRHHGATALRGTCSGSWKSPLSALRPRSVLRPSQGGLGRRPLYVAHCGIRIPTLTTERTSLRCHRIWFPLRRGFIRAVKLRGNRARQQHVSRTASKTASDPPSRPSRRAGQSPPERTRMPKKGNDRGTDIAAGSKAAVAILGPLPTGSIVTSPGRTVHEMTPLCRHAARRDRLPIPAR